MKFVCILHGFLGSCAPSALTFARHGHFHSLGKSVPIDSDLFEKLVQNVLIYAQRFLNLNFGPALSQLNALHFCQPVVVEGLYSTTSRPTQYTSKWLLKANYKKNYILRLTSRSLCHLLQIENPSGAPTPSGVVTAKGLAMTSQVLSERPAKRNIDDQLARLIDRVVDNDFGGGQKSIDELLEPFSTLQVRKAAKNA